jgi:2-methylcitrate dehydratase
MIKASADGWVAKGGVEAALLAASGLTGPDEIFEGHAGWGPSVAGRIDYEGLLAPLDGAFRIARARIKAFAVVGPAQTTVQSAVDIHNEAKFEPEDVEQIIVSLPDRVLSDAAVDDPAKKFPNNRETADHSFHYTAAIALIEGECGEAQYALEKIASPVVRRLIEKTELRADPEFSAQRSGGGGVKLILRDGRTFEKRYAAPPGHPKNPLSDAGLVRKYDRQMEALFPAGQSEAIKAAVFGLDGLGRISDLTRLLRRAGEA